MTSGEAPPPECRVPIVSLRERFSEREQTVFFLFALKLWRCEAFAENGEFQPVIQTVIAFYSSDTALFAVCKQEMVYGLDRGHGLHLHSFSSVRAGC